jgi:hypothetical protein
MRSRVLALAVFPAILLVAPATALGGDNVIASLPEPTTIDAYANRIVWSERSPEGYRLVEYSEGEVHQLPIAPGLSPFDVDLGPSSEGRTVAVYSRCMQILPPPSSSSDGRLGCDLYVYDFASGRESAITRVNSEVDERFPTIWRKRIAFTRTYRPKGKHRYGQGRAYWSPFPGRGRTRRLGRAPRYLPILDDLDMRGRRVGHFWGGEFGGGEVRLTTTGGGTSVLAAVPGSGAAAQAYGVLGVSLTAGFVYWLVTQTADAPEVGELRRYDLSRRREERATVHISPHTAGFAQDGSVSYQVTPRNEAGCELKRVCPSPYDIHRVDGLMFERAPRLRLR